MADQLPYTLDHLHTILVKTNVRIQSAIGRRLVISDAGGPAICIAEQRWNNGYWDQYAINSFLLTHLNEAADFIENYRREKT